jgi:hypothetical protein
MCLPALNALAHLGLCELAAVRLDEAETAAASALRLAAARGVTSTFQVRPAHITLAYVDLLHGDTDGADRRLAAGLGATEAATEPAPTLAVHIC